MYKGCTKFAEGLSVERVMLEDGVQSPTRGLSSNKEFRKLSSLIVANIAILKAIFTLVLNNRYKAWTAALCRDNTELWAAYKTQG